MPRVCSLLTLIVFVLAVLMAIAIAFLSPTAPSSSRIPQSPGSIVSNERRSIHQSTGRWTRTKEKEEADAAATAIIHFNYNVARKPKEEERRPNQRGRSHIITKCPLPSTVVDQPAHAPWQVQTKLRRKVTEGEKGHAARNAADAQRVLDLRLNHEPWTGSRGQLLRHGLLRNGSVLSACASPSSSIRHLRQQQRRPSSSSGLVDDRGDAVVVVPFIGIVATQTLEMFRNVRRLLHSILATAPASLHHHHDGDPLGSPPLPLRVDHVAIAINNPTQRIPSSSSSNHDNDDPWLSGALEELLFDEFLSNPVASCVSVLVGQGLRNGDSVASAMNRLIRYHFDLDRKLRPTPPLVVSQKQRDDTLGLVLQQQGFFSSLFKESTNSSTTPSPAPQSDTLRIVDDSTIREDAWNLMLNADVWFPTPTRLYELAHWMEKMIMKNKNRQSPQQPRQSLRFFATPFFHPHTTPLYNAVLGTLRAHAQVGYFDENYFPGRFEDNDHAWRVSALADVVVSPPVVTVDERNITTTTAGEEGRSSTLIKQQQQQQKQKFSPSVSFLIRRLTLPPSLYLCHPMQSGVDAAATAVTRDHDSRSGEHNKQQLRSEVNATTNNHRNTTTTSTEGRSSNTSSFTTSSSSCLLKCIEGNINGLYLLYKQQRRARVGRAFYNTKEWPIDVAVRQAQLQFLNGSHLAIDFLCGCFNASKQWTPEVVSSLAVRHAMRGLEGGGPLGFLETVMVRARREEKGNKSAGG